MTDEQLNKRFDDLTAKIGDLTTKITGTEARLIEKMRDMQTELLRGFEAFLFRPDNSSA
jgi:hypothetical protein